tara:strand:+ start:10212 stop:11171 length:960 start_codon:yes stop_codon:yes gene_type:complete
MKKNVNFKSVIFLFLFSILFIKFVNTENLKYTYSKLKELEVIKYPYHKIRDLVLIKDMIFIDKNNYKNQLKKYDCLPDLIKELPNESSVIIGHAYGRVTMRRYSSSISPYVNNFIKKNKNKIKTLIFTGDVFNVPTSKKWQKIYDNYKKDIEILIAPGNHDVGYNNENPKRDIFNKEVSKYQSIDFPYLIKRSGFNIILDDSTVGNSIFDFNSDFLTKLATTEKKLLVLRHHILIKEMQKNSGKTLKYYNKKIIKDKFKSFEDVSFISGNGGQRKKNDRIACIKYDKFTHIINGIGDVLNDNVLVLHNGNIYRYEINNF